MFSPSEKGGGFADSAKELGRTRHKRSMPDTSRTSLRWNDYPHRDTRPTSSASSARAIKRTSLAVLTAHVPAAAWPLAQGQEPLQGRLAARIVGQLGQDPDLCGVDSERMARYVGLTARRLRSRLAREGTSPARLLREFRCAAACAALRGGQRSVSDIAERLGYSESSAFQRAFKRWTGESPIAYARAVAGTGDPMAVHLQ